MKIEECNRPVLFAALLLAVLALAPAALAQSLSLKPPSLNDVQGRIVARFGVAVEDVPILKGELEDGLDLVLRCEVSLYRKNDFWMDSEVASGTFISELRYDSLAQEYVMTLPGTEHLVRGKDIGKLVEEGWKAIEVGLGSWTLLERGARYSLRLRTAMNEKGAPEGFMRYLYFWSWNPGAENSFQMDFTY
ncbi:MAG: DUF4390 domain-containing protein [Desulfovibrionaceae bacterium]|nr:DUF4390 domain-containing protein [Desulfovibrionaceae bacterium]